MSAADGVEDLAQRAEIRVEAATGRSRRAADQDIRDVGAGDRAAAIGHGAVLDRVGRLYCDADRVRCAIFDRHGKGERAAGRRLDRQPGRLV